MVLIDRPVTIVGEERVLGTSDVEDETCTMGTVGVGDGVAAPCIALLTDEVVCLVSLGISMHF
jgi:hypothetical protein